MGTNLSCVGGNAILSCESLSMESSCSAAHPRRGASHSCVASYAHLGITDQFQISQGHERAMLNVEYGS